MKPSISLIRNILKSQLIQDSFWSICGNGIANVFLLIAGIMIAHILGKDEYGEYGLVKTTMFFIASFASFGLNYTSTKLVASNLSERASITRCYTDASIKITFITSCSLAIILEVCSKNISSFLQEPSLTNPLRVLGILIIVRALIYTLSAILAGFGRFKQLAINNVIGGTIMIILAIPMTRLYGLYGALFTLLLSQIIYLLLNAYSTKTCYLKLPIQETVSVKKEILKISFPVALHEATYAIFQWSGTLLLTKMSTIGELGLFTAASQWNAIILFIPNILVNVIISNLSKNLKVFKQHHQIIKVSLILNIFCSFIPFCVILLLSGYISKLYGPTFNGLMPIINILIFSTIFICCSNVFYSEFISNGKTIIVFIGRILRDLGLLTLAYILIKTNKTGSSALYYAWATVFASGLHFIFLGTCYIKTRRKETNSDNDQTIQHLNENKED